jgi:hypothetical protein
MFVIGCYYEFTTQFGGMCGFWSGTPPSTQRCDMHEWLLSMKISNQSKIVIVIFFLREDMLARAYVLESRLPFARGQVLLLWLWFYTPWALSQRACSKHQIISDLYGQSDAQVVSQYASLLAPIAVDAVLMARAGDNVDLRDIRITKRCVLLINTQDGG